MAIVWSVTINKVTVMGDQRVVYATLTSPASGSDTYTAGGDTLLPSAVGLAYIDFVNTNAATIGGYASGGSNTLYGVNIIPGVGENVAAKVLLYQSTTGAPEPFSEVVAATSVASTTITCQFFGV
jgi:hypothetical protein